MSNRHPKLHELLLQDLAELKLTQIAQTYREVLDEAERKNTSLLEVLAALIAAEVALRASEPQRVIDLMGGHLRQVPPLQHGYAQFPLFNGTEE